MGGNSSASRVTIDQKMQFLENRVVKKCNNHGRQATLFCSIPSCTKSPYICEKCLQDKLHLHSEGIHDHNGFIKQLVTLIQLRRDRQNKILQTSIANPSQDYPSILKQQMKLMQHVESLETEIFGQIELFKKKLQSSIDRNKKKANRTASSRSDTYYRFYSNPNILVNKLISQQTDQFILDLKQKLNISANSQKFLKLSGQEEIAQLRTQLTAMKTSIREMLNVNHQYLFKKNGNVPTAPNSTFNFNFVTRKKLQIPGLPKRLFNVGEQVYVCTNRQVFAIDTYTKEKSKVFSEPISDISGLKSGSNQFIGMLNQTNLLFYDGRGFDKIGLLSKVSTVRLVKGNKNIYGVLGEDDGVINMINLSYNKSVFHYRCGDKPLIHIEICDKNQTIYAATKNGPLFMFKYKSRYEQLDFQYVGQMGQHIYPAGQLQLMRIRGFELIMMGPNRNIVVYDLMLNTEIVRTQYSNKSPPFINCNFLNHDGNQLMVTLHENEPELYIWNIDKIKKSVKVDGIEVAGQERVLLGMTCCYSQGQVWVIKDGDAKMVNILGIQ